MNLPVVVTPPSIYHGWSTWKMFWEEKLTQVTMRMVGRRNVFKHREIKDVEKYITLDISFQFVSLYKMKFISSEPKY